MGNYLNTVTAYDAYLKEYNSPYFVDKSPMLEELIARIDTGTNYICIIRPRRFGKSVMANMIASFFSRECNAGLVFNGLRIADSKPCMEYMGKYDVIFISFNELPRNAKAMSSILTGLRTGCLRI